MPPQTFSDGLKRRRHCWCVAKLVKSIDILVMRVVIFPQSVDRASCPIDVFGCEAAQAQVRSFAVVAFYGLIDPALEAGCPDLQRIQVLVLDDAVDSFGHGVVPRVSCLCHGDDASMLVQQRDIPVRAVLAPPVRVVYDRQVPIVGIPVVECLPEHVQGIVRTHVVTDGPPNNEP